MEYPLTRTATSEVQTLIRLAPQDLGGIVPLAMVSGWLLGGIGSLCACRHLCACVLVALGITVKGGSGNTS